MNTRLPTCSSSSSSPFSTNSSVVGSLIGDLPLNGQFYQQSSSAVQSSPAVAAAAAAAAANLLQQQQNLFQPQLTPLDLMAMQQRRQRSSSSCSLNYRNSPYNLSTIFNGDLNNLRRNSEPNSRHHSPCTIQSFDDDVSDDEQPLDMSKKSRTNSDGDGDSVASSGAGSSVGSAGSSSSQLRPSVITCATSLMRTNINESTPIGAGINGGNGELCTSCSLSNDFSKCMRNGLCCDTSSRNNNRTTVHKHPLKARIELACQENYFNKDHNSNTESTRSKFNNGVIADNNSTKKMILNDDQSQCDPVIEEHFRRSLGSTYTKILQNKTSPASISVDDHFAKALGDVWHKLKNKSDTKNCDESNFKRQHRIIS